MMPIMRTRALLVLTAGVLVATALGAVAPAGGRSRTYAIPGSRVFPEGVAYDARSRAFYVGSSENGQIFRGRVDGPAAIGFLAPGADGRTAATGMKVAGRRLYVAGAATGKVFVYALATKKLVARFDTGSGGFLNDLVVERDGDVIVTDSMRPDLYRITAKQVRAGHGTPQKIRYDTGAKGGFNANGIVVTGEHRVLFVDSGDGTLTAVDTTRRTTRRLQLTGGPVTDGDGLVLRGRTLYVVRNALGKVAKVALSANGHSAKVLSSFGDATFAYPTTAAIAGDRLLVVNSQFDKRGPGLTPGPFTLSSVALR
jgi:sugar lactone lactonase YvrE